MPSARNCPVEPTDLLGDWDFSRRIVDRDASSRRFGHVVGTLTFALADDAVMWCERGSLTWNGQRLAVYRDLRIVRRDGGWMVCFDDGREFHPWQPGTPVVHPCRADTYRGVVAVDPECDRLRVLWDVTGPDKDRRLFTRARRTSCGPTSWPREADG